MRFQKVSRSFKKFQEISRSFKKFQEVSIKKPIFCVWRDRGRVIEIDESEEMENRESRYARTLSSPPAFFGNYYLCSGVYYEFSFQKTFFDSIKN
jgi:hypothetical protein